VRQPARQEWRRQEARTTRGRTTRGDGTGSGASGMGRQLTRSRGRDAERPESPVALVERRASRQAFGRVDANAELIPVREAGNGEDPAEHDISTWSGSGSCLTPIHGRMAIWKTALWSR
jgi:hypothetical protein